jgi:hypothetical protein
MLNECLSVESPFRNQAIGFLERQIEANPDTPDSVWMAHREYCFSEHHRGRRVSVLSGLWSSMQMCVEGVYGRLDA